MKIKVPKTHRLVFRTYEDVDKVTIAKSFAVEGGEIEVWPSLVGFEVIDLSPPRKKRFSGAMLKKMGIVLSIEQIDKIKEFLEARSSFTVHDLDLEPTEENIEAIKLCQPEWTEKRLHDPFLFMFGPVEEELLDRTFE